MAAKVNAGNSFIPLPSDTLLMPCCSIRASDHDMAPKSRLEEAKVAGTMSTTGTAPQPSLSSLEEFDTDNEDAASRSCRCLLSFGYMCPST
ncbi:hypothetical protein QBC45DRAFT_206667 [Copromyces sp. CBS 386.78]|nr:hypothetical protein QBC45DRAFT_206667 [Copromyces sp. CBS 386.78]